MTVKTGQNGVSDHDKTLLVPSRLFADQTLVVVGGTGFLGKVWVSMLLHRFPEIGHLYLLVRPKEGQTPDERFWAQIAPSPVFDPLRERHGAGFDAFLRAKITPVAGDVVEPLLGLSPELIERLVGKVAAVVNVAGVVDFNPPLDEALDVNAFGVHNLAGLAKKLQAKVMHTSTCYVAGYRAGLIEEDDPRKVPFPRAAGETWYGAACPKRTLEPSHWDPQREIAECLDIVKQARHRSEDAFRQSSFLDEAKHRLTSRGEPSRGQVLEDELAKVKRAFIQDHLVEAGLERALFWGFTNIYTYTKAIGEQVLAASGVPFCIVRPAVIESSCVYPFPGWNEGINTSAPFLYMASKGQMQFPGDRDVHLDIIPVDMVTSAMIASLAELVEGTAPFVYQYGTADTNRCSMARYMELAALYKRKLVFEGKKTGIFDLVSSRFESRGITKKQYQTHGARQLASAMRGASFVLDKVAHGPLASIFKPAAKALANAAKTEAKTADVLEIFMPFVAEAEWIFSCANTRAAMARMSDAERAKFLWEPEKIDWRDWMFNVHLPGLEKWVYPLIEEKMRREVRPLRAHEHLLDVLDEAADQHEHAVALQRLGPEGLSRTTFREWRRASVVVAKRLVAAGVKAGDRVLLAGDNQPAWPMAYFGILRAGAVAVPVDPALEGTQMAQVARASCAKVALWDQGVANKSGGAVRAVSAELRAFDLVAFVDDAGVPDDELGTETLPAPKATDLASIIYTSGTTGDPKGVMLSHQNFAALVAALAPIFELGPKDRVLSVLPLHHTFEFTCGMLLPLSRGARILYLDELKSERVAEGLSKGRITAMVGVPALWQLLERRIRSRVGEGGPLATMAFDAALDFNRMLGSKVGINAGRLFFGTVHEALGAPRFFISGGAALPKDTKELFRGLGVPLSEGYGLTEAAPVLTVSKAGPKERPGQVGKAIPGVEIRIDKPDEKGVGEVLARGPNVMQGYANNPEATAAVLDGGWLRTGDLGSFDKKKNLVIAGRSKDVIVAANGENVYPDDVEDLLGTVEHVRELAIVGIEDGRGGERVACLAVPTAEAAPGSDDGDVAPLSRSERHARAMVSLRDAFTKLPRACQPAVTHLYDADLPRTATRKVKRSEVKAILARLVGATELPATSERGSPTAVRHAIAAIANRPTTDITERTSLKADLGFDSLMAMELHVALEAQAKRAIDPERLASCEIVADVEQLVGERPTSALGAVEDVPEEKIAIPPVVAETAKLWMGKIQMGFYDKVMQPKVYGRAYIPHNRNTIVISNHASHLDMGFVKYALGAYGQGIVSLAAQDYFFDGSKWRRAYFENLTNLAAFDRKGGLRQALRQAGDLIEQGKTLLLFPEGTRSPDGGIHEFKPVVGHLALTYEVDILPVYLGGTYQAMPKGGKVPMRRDIRARIGPPLEVRELKRLTEGMKFPVACRKVAELAHTAVLELKEGRVLDLRKLEQLDGAPAREHPLTTLFRELEGKYVAGRVTQPITYYFTLGTEVEAKWTLRIGPEGCEARLGKPESAQADCVLKTSAEIFTKIVREAYTPSPMEFMSGAVKSNDLSLLQTFQKAFDLA